MERRKALKVKRTDWLRRVKGLLDEREFEELAKVPRKQTEESLTSQTGGEVPA